MFEIRAASFWKHAKPPGKVILKYEKMWFWNSSENVILKSRDNVVSKSAENVISKSPRECDFEIPREYNFEILRERDFEIPENVVSESLYHARALAIALRTSMEVSLKKPIERAVGSVGRL